jgi:hypothetical protein
MSVVLRGAQASCSAVAAPAAGSPGCSIRSAGSQAQAGAGAYQPTIHSAGRGLALCLHCCPGNQFALQLPEQGLQRHVPANGPCVLPLWPAPVAQRFCGCLQQEQEQQTKIAKPSYVFEPCRFCRLVLQATMTLCCSRVS